MNSLVIALALCSLAVFVRADSYDEEKNKATQKCNVTHPVQRNPRLIMAKAISSGEKVQMSQEEKCHLLCFLKEINFFDKDGNIQGAKLTQTTIQQAPEIASYADVLIAKIYQLNKMSKSGGFGDECNKAFEIYQQYGFDVFAFAIAKSLENRTSVKEKMVNYVSTGQPLDDDLKQQIETQLAFFEKLANALAAAQ